MKFLLTNDDGIESEGLAALEASVRESLSPDELWVVAPDRPRSQCAHATTATASLEAYRRGEGRYAVNGYPADCIRIALFGLGVKPDWVLSGINHGGNLGHDIALSGTVAAAREAAYHGVAAAAVSHFINEGPVDWSLAARRAAFALQEIMGKRREDGYWNINLPHTLPSETGDAALSHCEPERAPLPAEYESESINPDVTVYRSIGRYQSRKRVPESDVDVCFGGRISISRLGI